MDQLDIKRDSVSLATLLLLDLNRTEIQKCIDSRLYENFDCILIGSNVDSALNPLGIKTESGIVVHSTYFAISEPLLPASIYPKFPHTVRKMADHFIVPAWIACLKSPDYDSTLMVPRYSSSLVGQGISKPLQDVTVDYFTAVCNQDGFHYEYSGVMQHATTGFFHLVFAFSKNKPKTCCPGCRAEN